MSAESIIEKAKNAVAEMNGYPDNVLGTRWEYAMSVTHRSKRQLELYEQVVSSLAQALAEHEITKGI